MLCRALFWVQQGALFEARLPGGHLQYRRATKLPSNGVDMICEDPEDDDIVPARRQQAEPENDCKIHLDVRTTLLAALTLPPQHPTSCMAMHDTPYNVFKE
jgi:hypothetical protein